MVIPTRYFWLFHAPVKVIDTMKANVDDFLSPTLSQEHEKAKSSELE